jgi:hypothetical protein
MPLNEHTIKAAGVALFGVAEHEVEDLCRKLADMVRAGGGGTPGAAAGPSQEAFDELKAKVEEQQALLDDLTKPDASSSSTDTASGDAPHS